MTNFKTISEPSSPDSSWSSPPKEIILKSDEIHVWLVSLGEVEISKFEFILSREECEKAKRFRFEKPKTQFVATRMFLRAFLAKYLREDPQKIRFEYNEYGKPAIKSETNCNLKFSVSHSGETALLAFALEDEIGIDLEKIEPSLADEKIALRVLTKKEMVRFLQLPASERMEFFYQCWTRKEAVSKAVGTGFVINPDKFEAFFLSENSDNREITNISDWSFFQPPPVEGYAANLVVEGNREKHLEFWRASPDQLFEKTEF